MLDVRCDVLDVSACDLCVIGNGMRVLRSLQALRRLVPRRGHVVMIDDGEREEECLSHAIAPRLLAGAFERLWCELWGRRTCAQVSFRHGCRVLACRPCEVPGGQMEMLIDYLPSWKGASALRLRARRVIQVNGF